MKFHITILIAGATALLGMGTSLADESESKKDAVTYEQHVRPILKAMCFQCHGEGDDLQSGLDVRLRRLIVKGGESGPAVVAGDLEKSLLYERVQSGEMPPGDTKLSKLEVATIANWIRSGAKTARPEPESADSFTFEERNFWSFQPIQRPRVPAVDAVDRVRTPIDSYLLAKLEERKLGFSDDADKTVLIRRVFFDLIGLPPSPEEIDAFIADESADAYERLIDRLLASPHYGERWGRHWLDVAGYADSEGFTDADTVRDSAFRFRDYVIRSFNADKPFDRFIHEQLAGDELVTPPYNNLTPEGVEKLVATGFLRMAPDGTGSGGIDLPLARNQVVAETIKVVSTSLLGLTVGCAQCHNHRYDPIPQADYYRMRAIFEPAFDWKHWRAPAARRISLYTDDDRTVAAKIEADAKIVDVERAELTKKFIDITLEDQLRKVAEEVRDPLRTAYKTEAAKRSPEQKELLDKYPRILKISAGSLYLYDREIRTEAAKLDAERTRKEKEFVERAFAAELAKLPAELALQLRTARDTAAASQTAVQKALLAEHTSSIVTVATLGKFDTDAASELEKLKKAATDLRATQKADRVKTLQEQAAAIRATKPPEGFVRPVTEIPGRLPETFLFYRGDHEQPKQKLAPAGLSILDEHKLAPIPANDAARPSSGRRLAFARRLTDPTHPLTARVLVNRVWLNHFGRGIVETPGDFGFLGSKPTHPKLLDWLAHEFMDGGWQLKRLHKLIMTSTAYRQSSRRSAAQDEVDPDNRLYDRRSIRRLESEIVRDSILAISGKINDKLYGEPVPVMEDAVGQIIIGKENLDGERKPGATIPLHGEEFRRSLYIQVRRSRLLGVLDTFDAPTMEPNCTIRNSSTVTPQALMLMNSEFATGYAALIAERVRTAAGENATAQVAYAWRLAFGIRPSDEQIAASVLFLKKQRDQYQQEPPKGVTSSPYDLAFASFCQSLISSNGFLYVD